VGGGLTRGLIEAMGELPHNVVCARDVYGADNFELPPKNVKIEGGNGGGFDIGPEGLRDLMAG